jgi:hypothetical protein
MRFNNQQPRGKPMAKITIDEKEYETDDMSDDAKAQLQSLQFVDSEITRNQMKAAALQTARNAYAQALQTALEEAK